jgi:choline-glycine betaine transporter
MAINRRTLIVLAVVDVLLFVLANVTIKNDKTPGTVSDVFWITFLIGVALLIVLGVVTVIKSRRAPAP